MTVEQLQQLATELGLKAPASQTQVIRFIQLAGGGEPCFSSEKRYACTQVCDWRQECRKLRAQWRA